MTWFLRKAFRLGPLRLNLSKRGVGISGGVKGLRFGAPGRVGSARLPAAPSRAECRASCRCQSARERAVRPRDTVPWAAIWSYAQERVVEATAVFDSLDQDLSGGGPGDR
jgi:hypothetical protein